LPLECLTASKDIEDALRILDQDTTIWWPVCAVPDL
jgi:hypothetical protein